MSSSNGYANYEKGVGKDYLKLTSCNTTGLIRAVGLSDRAVGVEARHRHHHSPRVGRDPGDTHRGLVDVAQVEPVPNHQAVESADDHAPHRGHRAAGARATPTATSSTVIATTQGRHLQGRGACARSRPIRGSAT